MENKKWVVASRPESMVTEDNFRIEVEDLSSPGAGEFLIEVNYIRTSPPQRMALVSGGLTKQPIPIGNTMPGFGLGKVVESNHHDFAVGDLVTGGLGWQQYVISNGTTTAPVKKIQPTNTLPVSAQLHIFGSAGMTAYFGIYDYGKPKPGDTLVVSTAAGAVGTVVCQMGKIEGCRVIGIAGGQKKCDWLMSELRIDGAIDYRSENVHERLRELCPNGIDIYFDNVGGETLDAALDLIAQGARVILCGASSQYTNDLDFYGPKNYFNLVYKQAQMYGYFINNFADRFDEARAKLEDMAATGNLKYAEDILDGLEQLPKALERVLTGANFGAQLVRVAR
ncbi:MAG: NADP-dependent oxidoreductase [Proteobacteria bacterium]|nr:NADP-dependent oxidoreductase [Pseudomonadota bacterium]